MEIVPKNPLQELEELEQLIQMAEYNRDQAAARLSDPSLDDSARAQAQAELDDHNRDIARYSKHRDSLVTSPS